MAWCADQSNTSRRRFRPGDDRITHYTHLVTQKLLSMCHPGKCGEQHEIVGLTERIDTSPPAPRAVFFQFRGNIFSPLFNMHSSGSWKEKLSTELMEISSTTHWYHVIPYVFIKTVSGWSTMTKCMTHIKILLGRRKSELMRRIWV